MKIKIKYASHSKSYFTNFSISQKVFSQGKCLKFDDSVHLKYCLYIRKYANWRLSLSTS